MFDDININSLDGIKKIIAPKCDQNNDGILQDTNKLQEVSIFNKTCKTIKGTTFIYNGQAYNADGTENYTREVPREIKMPEFKMFKKPKNLTQKDSISTSYDWSPEWLNNSIEQMTTAPRYKGKYKKSILRGKAQAFINSGKKWDIDPRILLAVAMQESARGTKTRGKNSVGGPKQNFNSIEESIDHIAQRIDTIRTKQHRKKTTVDSIAFGYTNVKASAPTWSKNVNSYINQATKYYEPPK